MPSKLSNLFDNLSGIFNKESEKCRERKEIRVESKFIGYRNNRLNYTCKECNELCAKSPTEAIKNFPNLRKFCNGDLNNFFLLLGKGVYPYEYMDNWKKSDETSIPPKEPFYSKLNEEGISDADYERVKKVWEVFEIKNLGEYHGLYVQCDTLLLLADVFENFKDMYIKIYKLDPVHFLSAPGLAWQACLKYMRVNLELLTNIDMLLMVEEGIRRGICQATHSYAKANNKYMNNYDKNIESSYIEFLDAKNLYG